MEELGFQGARGRSYPCGEARRMAATAMALLADDRHLPCLPIARRETVGCGLGRCTMQLGLVLIGFSSFSFLFQIFFYFFYLFPIFLYF